MLYWVLICCSYPFYALYNPSQLNKYVLTVYFRIRLAENANSMVSGGGGGAGPQVNIQRVPTNMFKDS